MRYVVVYEKTETGYSAYVPDLPGCVSAGDSLRETKRMIRQAVELHLAGMREDGQEASEPSAESEYVDLPA